MITKILRQTLAHVRQYELDNPEEARCISPGLAAFKFQIGALIQYIEQPTAEDLEDHPEEVEAEPVMLTGKRH